MAMGCFNASVGRPTETERQRAITEKMSEKCFEAGALD